MQAVIEAVDFAVPEKRMANTDFPASLETSDEWIRSHTGIGSRHVADPDVATSDLAAQASKKVLKRAGVRAEDIDLILVATATPDFIGFPSVACIVQDKIGAKNAAAMDIVAGCTGFIYALETARAFVMSGQRRQSAGLWGRCSDPDRQPGRQEYLRSFRGRGGGSHHFG